MLCQLSIKNIALIDNLTIEFTEGMNVLTGETGAGKSIVIDSMNLALGERADRDLIRAGQERASVEALFDITSCPALFPVLEESGIETDGGQLIVSRVLTTAGRNIVRINGVLTPLSLLRQITSALVDVHGQHEHQYLMDEGRHLGFLDSYAHNEISPAARRVEELSVCAASTRARRSAPSAWICCNSRWKKFSRHGSRTTRRKNCSSSAISSATPSAFSPRFHSAPRFWTGMTICRLHGFYPPVGVAAEQYFRLRRTVQHA